MVLAAGADSNVDVHPILVDADGRPYVILHDPASVTQTDTVATHPDGIGTFGRRDLTNAWREMPVAAFSDVNINKGDWIVPVTPMTSEKEEGTKITDGTNTMGVNGANAALTTVLGLLPDGVNGMPSGDDRARPIYHTPGFQDDFHVHLHKDAIGANTGLMLVDLSDNVNWPHTHIGGVTLHRVIMSIAATKLTDAHVQTNGSNWFGPISANNALFQTDVNLFGPDGTVAFPSGDGDLVLLVDWTAGTINVSCSIDYETWPPV